MNTTVLIAGARTAPARPMEIDMLTRICLVGAIVAGCLLAVLGLLVLPMTVLIAGAFVAVLTGPLVAMCVHSVHPGSGDPVRAGARAAAATLAIVMVGAGLAVLLGPVAMLVLPLLVAAGVWWYPRHRSATSTPRATDLARPRSGLQPARGPGPATPAVPRINTGAVPTEVLCATWQRTYWLLRDLPADSPDRPVVIEARGRLLEEFERRDPDGFGRWLDTHPRACSDPGRYLRVDR